MTDGMMERWKYGKMVRVVLVCCAVVAMRAEAQEREAPAVGLVELASEPSRAEVYVGDSLVGHTPMRLRGAMLDSVHVWFPSRGAWDAQVRRPDTAAPPADMGVVLLRFDARRMFEAVPAGRANVLGDELRIPSASVLIPAGLGLAAGVAAVVFKQHADGLYDDYLRSGDESLLSQTKKYDIYAGVSLALLQVGLGYLIYRLFDE
jgi:hypothetical protein